MNAARFVEITAPYSTLRIAVVGDFCLDRYLEIDPNRQEASRETGLPVYNVVNVRSQPGGAGTILNNLVALGVSRIYPVGFCGEDGEGFELLRALENKRGVRLDYFTRTRQRRTFTYTKPLLTEAKKPPVELNRLDIKNWTATPPTLRRRHSQAVRALSSKVDALVVLDQVDVANTGVVTGEVLDALSAVTREHPNLLILADSRRGLRRFPRVIFKMNTAELSAHVGSKRRLSLAQIWRAGAALAKKNGRPVFVTLAHRGILGASPTGEVEHAPALPVRGEIDVVGAGDAVTANLAAALAAGASLREAVEIANAAASIVIHQFGTTGTATVPQIRAAFQAVEGIH